VPRPGAEVHTRLKPSPLGVAFGLVLALAGVLPAADVGEGAPNSAITLEFIQAYYRGGFHTLVTGPTAGVRILASTGLVQEFAGINETTELNVRYALVRPSRTGGTQGDSPGVFQIHADIYSYYGSLGAGTVGFPTMDTQSCPAYETQSVCTFQLFNKGYALFAYKTALLTGQNFQIRGNFYTRWTNLGGTGGIGIPVENESSVTSPVGAVTATAQTFKSGAIYSITSGTFNGRVFGVSGSIYVAYAAQNKEAGHLGLPVSDEYAVADGRRRQDFQGGSIEYAPGSDAQLRYPVHTLSLGRYDSLGSLRVNLGDTIEVTAIAYAANGLQLADRQITWSTSNSRVVAVQPGPPAILRAVGGGSALITAVSEGKSKSLTLFVSAPCCQVGEGAPTAEIQRSFQDAITRSRLAVAVPSPFPVRRVGAGYVQDVASPEGVRHLLAKSDRISTAYVISGELLASYERAAGPLGSFGYPVSDASSGGAQLFEGGALAGTPPRPVTGALLTKWATLGYETGAAGPPSSDAQNFVSANSTGGAAQSFRGGVIYALTTGPRRGQAYFVSGTILARYATLNGPAGELGAPQSDEFAAGGLARQNFENGSIEYAAGEAAREQVNERHPAVSALPASVIAGSRVRVIVSGFAAGSTLRVSVTGQPDFTVAAVNGSYSWESYIPLNAPSASVTVRAVDAAAGVSAGTAYTVRPLTQARVQLTKVGGDNQLAPPGARLPAPLRVRVLDEEGNAVIGIPVAFRASPGAQVLAASVPTDENGEAAAAMRLPAAPGIALATAEVAGAVVTFSSQAAGISITNFPAQRQSGDALLGNSKFTIAQKGALLAAASAIVRYYQNRGEMLAANGLAEPALLNEYLKTWCAFDAQGGRICDGFLTNPDSGEPVVNLWRLAGFVTGGLEIVIGQPGLSSVADFVAQGQPVLLALALTADSVPIGGHFVVAIGVDQDGGLLIHDPHPALARTRLAEYTGSFAAGGKKYEGKLTAVIRLLPQIAGPRRFLLSAVSLAPDSAAALSFDVRSAAGACGLTAEIQDLAIAGGPAPAAPRISRFAYCDGSHALYQAGVIGPAAVSLTDFATGGGVRQVRVGIYRVTRPAVTLELAPLGPTLEPPIVNAATMAAGLAPGSAAVARGAGLAGPNGEVSVSVGDMPAQVISANAFQVRFQAPLGLSPGSHTLRISSPFGVLEQPLEIREAAPAIFLTAAGRGAVFNQNGTANSAVEAVSRGQAVIVYATGLGAVVERGNVSVTANPVVAVINGLELPASFAGIAPDLVGVYQINLVLPLTIPPGLDLPFSLRQAGVESNQVAISIQ
jgi:uncharacterized protein (TIGR03437 family)